MRKIIHFFIFTFVLTFSIFLTKHVNAAESSVMIKTEEKTVTINIKEQGDRYKVFKEDNLVYEGSSNQIQDQLTDDFQKYKIGIYEDNKIKKVLKITIDNPIKEQRNTQ
ncbi:hypothetical protein MOF34_15730 [Bacillus sp. T17B1]|uniref:hypothetical protein n=1 Tax=Bacillus sp. T17B1 TaxID=2918911 RepID=UPI002280433B|nr:hypothetical protein [Bacillus sp. T17B1]